MRNRIKQHYTVVLLLVTVAFFAMIYPFQKEHNLSEEGMYILLSIMYLINLIGIPVSFGFLGLFSKLDAVKIWKGRFLFLSILNLCNILVYYFVHEQSVFFLMLVGLGVLLLNKPQGPKSETDEDK